MDRQSLIASEIEKWIQIKTKEANAKGVVYGLSGGLDSAVVSLLAKRALGEKAIAVIMPCDGSKKDLEHAQLMVNKFELRHKVVDLTDSYNQMIKTLDPFIISSNQTNSRIAKSNLKPRLRMATLYYYAAVYGYLVLGTGNKSEMEIGYFTKYGDGGVDLEPIGNLLKEEVKKLAVHLKIPEEIIEKKPTAGLWEGQTDEEELGFSYQELDNYLRNGIGSEKLKEKIENLRESSQHKKQIPPTPESITG